MNSMPQITPITASYYNLYAAGAQMTGCHIPQADAHQTLTL
jgi:hypothetical protein